MARPGKLIVRKALDIGALKIKLTHEGWFTWKSGLRTPFYLNNRAHLGFCENRELIIHALVRIIEDSGLKFDAILGVTTAGIPWAAGVAEEMKTRLLMQEGKKVFEIDAPENLEADHVDCALVASNSPFGIPLGLHVARRNRLPFMYVRAEEKGHGLKSRLEGYSKNPVGEKIGHGEIVNFYDSGEEVNTLMYTQYLNSIGFVAHAVQGKSPIREISIAGLKVLVIEDLISTGTSSITVAQILRELGAEVTDIVSIFDYQLPDSKLSAEKAKITFHSLSNYQDAMEVGIATKLFSAEQAETISKWRMDIHEWSDTAYKVPA